MTKAHSTLLRKKSKPAKPHKDFPLFPHGSGQWAKKVRGQLLYFGAWSDHQAALEKWLREKDDRLAGRTPRNYDPDALTVGILCNLFLENRERRVKTGELAQCTFDDHLSIGKQVVAGLGRNTPVDALRPADFAELRDLLADGVNLKTLEGRIACARAIFNHADKNGLLDTPLSKLWGTEFAKPSKTALNKLKVEGGRLFTPAQVWSLLDHAGPQLAAMIWLGLNCGFGNTDLARLTISAVDRTAMVVNLSRSKTGKSRRVPIWPESLKAMDKALECRPAPKDSADADLVFVTKQGNSWLPKAKDNPLSKEFSKLRKAAGVTAKGLSFYGLRHTFQTIADETKDFVAVSAVMGHTVASISDHYRERIGEDRLRAVTDHVRQWLLAGKGGAE